MRGRKTSGRVIAGVLVMLMMGGGAIMTGASAAAIPTTIINNAEWEDQPGSSMKCHGGNITQIGSDYFWMCSDLTADANRNWKGFAGVYVYK